MHNVGSRPRHRISSVFIADDDNDDIEFFKEALNHIDSHIQVEHLRNGIELTKALYNYLPDLLFIDLDMPVKNGLQCLLEIRKEPKMVMLPIVIFSSTTRPANINTAYEMGADLFFIKPSNYNELYHSLETILKLDWSGPEKIKEQFYNKGQYNPFSAGENSSL